MAAAIQRIMLRPEARTQTLNAGISTDKFCHIGKNAQALHPPPCQHSLIWDSLAIGWLGRMRRIGNQTKRNVATRQIPTDHVRRSPARFLPAHALRPSNKRWGHSYRMNIPPYFVIFFKVIHCHHRRLWSTLRFRGHEPRSALRPSRGCP